MKQFALKLHQSLREDLQLCRSKGLDPEKELECCFQICTHYWHQLRQVVAIYTFRSEAEEIDFFKHLKPLFTSEIEYYNLLYQAHLFEPSGDEKEIQKFWAREATRLQRFSETHKEFYTYWQKRETACDAVYFLRKNKNDSDCPQLPTSLLEQKTSTSHDWLVTLVMALEKYTLYALRQLDEWRGATNSKKGKDAMDQMGKIDKTSKPKAWGRER